MKHVNESATDTVLEFMVRINQHEVDKLAEYMTEDHIFIDSLGQSVSGREKMRSGWLGYFGFCPDYRVSHEEVLSSGKLVAVFGAAGGAIAADGKLPPENRWRASASRARRDRVNFPKAAIASAGEPVMSGFQFCPRCAAPLAERTLQGEVRSACSANCGFVHYDNPTPVVAAVVEHNGMVVLAHNRGWPQTFRSFYGLITGFLERAESPEQCALREVKEELDLVGTAATLIGVYPFEQMNQVIIAYHVPASGTVTLNHELDDFRRVPLAECKAWSGGTGLALRDWLRSKGFEPPMLEVGRQTTSE